MFSSFVYSSPIGEIGLLKDKDTLISVSLTDPLFKDLASKKEHKNFKEIIRQLDEYFFEGRKIFNIEYSLSATNFGTKVYKEMYKIPYGNTISYSELAKKVRNPRAYRAVGNLCGKNLLPIIIPCHRVIAKSSIGGFTGGLGIKKFLLKLERN
tara:strand:+ start:2232 stop:2690 length:459 start_codon:yes stop_codon:yes gene_type:complete